MIKKVLLFLFLSTNWLAFSQDTTWVQTFTFDSITTRRAQFVFPSELNQKRFEKVLMYYKLKCSPLTTFDQYNCGEWDYLTYTRVFDHTGMFDSIQMGGNQFLANTQMPDSIQFDNLPYTYKDTYVRKEHFRTGSATTSFPVATSTPLVSSLPFDLSSNGGRFQMLVTAEELIASGLQPGNIQSLSVYLNSFLVNKELKYPTISLKATTDTTLFAFATSGFTTVYDASHWSGGSQGELSSGQNELLFYQPFLWNGTDNILIEFYFENLMEAQNTLLFDGDSIAQNKALSYPSLNGCMAFDGSDYSLMEFSDTTLGNDVTISFWAKGTGSAGTNTSLLEAYDTLGNRVLNIHMPWSDNSLYFDAGGAGGYDRISKAMTTNEIDGNWNHWAFVKKQETGEMFVYKNGSLWLSGTGKNRSVGYVYRFVLGANKNKANNWKGKIDDFQLFDSALDQATIQAWMNKKPNDTHPFWNNLLVSYDFDNQQWAEDRSQHDYLLMPSHYGMFDFDEYPNAGVLTSEVRPVIAFGQGSVGDSVYVSNQTEDKLKEPTIVFEQHIQDRHLEISNAFVSVLSGSEQVFDTNGTVLTSQVFNGANTLLNDTLIYYQKPFEVVKDVEIARYITPYGINFDLGPNGFYWIYDVTDYQDYLKDTVDLAAHNTQELLDLKFAFIEGIPPRDLHKRQPIWSDYKSYNYLNLSNNSALPEVPVVLSDTSGSFKIKTRLTGHGQQGNGGCCEWASKNHQIKVDGTTRFSWDIWQTNQCGENPNISQGGTWPYAREGWCPGDQVRENEFELTPFVTPGDTTRLDYVIEAIPQNDLGQGSGNYIVAMDLISYSAPNFQHDAALVDVLNPNNWEYYSKWNPTCSNPRVMIQNTGEQPLTKCKIRCWITNGNWLDYDWTGNLTFLQKEIVEIPVVDFAWWNDAAGSLTFTAQVVEIEGVAGMDEYAQNNVKSTKFAAPDVINGPFYIWFTTNNKASENKYRLEDANGNVLFERLTLQNSTQYKDTFNLATGCYSIVIEDSDYDGIGFWYSNQTEGETTGQFRIRKVGGTTINNFPSDFGHYHRYNFSVGFTLGMDELTVSNELSVYPNPTNGECMIEVSGSVNGKADLYVYDVMGRLVHAQPMNATAQFAEANPNFSALPLGRYIVKVVTNENVLTKEFIKF